MTKSQLNVGRLRELYAMLLGVPEDQFNLGVWRSKKTKTESGNEYDTGRVTDKELITNECGSVACAVGWACAYPPFKEAGLAYQFEDGAGAPVVRGSGAWSFSAVMQFFGLDREHAEWLFSQSKYRTFIYPGPKHVCARILEVLYQYGAITEARWRELEIKDKLPVHFNSGHPCPDLK
jgi:hypothetical protein